MNIQKILLFCFLAYLFSCVDPNSASQRNPEGDAVIPKKERKVDTRRDLDTESGRDAEIRRLKAGSRTIRSTLEDRYDGGFYYEGYGGTKCEESDACMAMCDSQVDRKNQRKCYRMPRSLVEALEDGFFRLLNISNDEPVEINPGLIAGILDINEDLLTRRVEDQMSEGDLKSFLAWVALNEDIAEVFLKEDRRAEILEKAFEELGDFQTGVNEEVETGLNVGLIQNQDSFFALAALDDNSAAFQIAYKILKSACRSRDCKMNILCAREHQTRRGSVIFGYESSILSCKTSASEGRRNRSNSICYVHGAATWSFINELIEDDDINDSHFRGEEDEITVERCNEYCGDEDSEKCERIL